MLIKRAEPWKKFFFYLIIFFSTFFVIVARRPDIITNPQLWAEDGAIWLKQAYDLGFIHSLLLPANGYYQTISRLTIGAYSLVGIENVALFSTLIAISIRCLFLCLILSSRMRFIPMRFRFVFCLYFLLMPNIDEGYINITNAHWYLCMYLLAVIISDEPKGAAWQTHDIALCILSCLSGPFVIFMSVPLLVKRLIQNKSIVSCLKNIKLFDVVFLVCFLIQIQAILGTSDANRPSHPLGFSVHLLVNIIGYRISSGFILDNLAFSNIAHDFQINLALCFVSLLIVIFCFCRGDWRVRSIAFMAIIMLSLTLIKPTMSDSEDQWPLLLVPGLGERYFFIINCIWFCGIAYFIANITKIKIMHYVLYAMCIYASFSYFKIYPLEDVGYRRAISELASSQPGSQVKIPLNPLGLWSVTLQKK